mmetsp:Transcript_2960/g.10223  ORF Transcript_2960/g.10223 Transcript_2960/m.10223 type:complete len:148 (+) Transcript_2960:873-1316(+)
MTTTTLGSWFSSSPHVAGLVEKGRATQGRPQHWDCGYSDVTLGYALGSANLSLSLLSVSDAMRDATYGAMDASRFVVSHHLRSGQMFEREAARAKAQPAWSPLLGECEAWPAVRAEAGGASAELQAAMRTFECCQRWKLCRLGPAAK